ncbi:hypothetical protein TUM17384_27830 [Shewanella algae]|nr:hypothetical protein TUM17384_27830 [Shewanella algae]
MLSGVRYPTRINQAKTLSKKEIFSYYESGKLYSYEIYVDLKLNGWRNILRMVSQ